MREKTGAPLMDVKKALAATEFDMEAAHAELRKRGLAAAGKKAGRVAADGLVGVKVSDCGRYAGVVEVNSETDFVSRNEHFLALVANAAAAVVKVDVGTLGNPAPGSAAEIPLAALEALPLPDGGETLADAAAATAATVRENIRLRRAFVMAATSAGEAIGHYVHGAVAPGMGRQAGLVKVTGAKDSDSVAAAASKVAMHAVAVSPRFLDPASVPEDVMEGEMAILRAQTENAGKPANIVEKIVAGRMKKFYEETCLSNQKFVMDDSKTVGKWLAGEDGLALGAFVRVKVGEGIEVQATDFAAEVAATVADSK